MPSIQVSPETFEELQKLAAERGRTPGAVIAELVRQRSAGQMSRDERGRLLEALLESVDSHVPEGWSQDDIEAAAVEAVREVRAERRARGR